MRQQLNAIGLGGFFVCLFAVRTRQCHKLDNQIAIANNLNDQKSDQKAESMDQT